MPDTQPKSNYTEVSWESIRNTGILWWINRTLHLFGLVIVMDVGEDGTVSRVYPARTRYRGFPEDAEDEGFTTLTSYIAATAGEWVEEIKPDTVIPVEPKPEAPPCDGVELRVALSIYPSVLHEHAFRVRTSRGLIKDRDPSAGPCLTTLTIGPHRKEWAINGPVTDSLRAMMNIYLGPKDGEKAIRLYESGVRSQP